MTNKVDVLQRGTILGGGPKKLFPKTHKTVNIICSEGANFRIKALTFFVGTLNLDLKNLPFF